MHARAARNPLDDARLRVRVAPEASSSSSSSWSSSSSSSAACALESTDSVLVFLDAHAALFECAGDAFLAGGPTAGSHWPAGQCTPCREARVPGKPATGLAPSLQAEAALRSALAGCPALTARPDESMCRNRTEPKVEADHARFEDVGTRQAELNDAEPRKWQCHVKYFELGEGSGLRCAVCGELLLCCAGLYWKNCSRTENSMCDACPDLLLHNTSAGAAGQYASNEEYVEASGPAADVEEATVEHALGARKRRFGTRTGAVSCAGAGSSSSSRSWRCLRRCRSGRRSSPWPHAPQAQTQSRSRARHEPAPPS